MAEVDEIFNRINKKAAENFLRISEERQKTLDWLENYKEDLFSKIAEALAEKNKVPIFPKTPLRNRRPKRRALSSSTDEDHTTSKAENLSTNITVNSVNSTGKPKRNASKLAEQKINKQAQIKLNTKMRQPGKDDTVLNDISNSTIPLNIKSEKKSHSPVKEPVPQIVLKPELEKVKKEIMPPPAAKPKRGRKKIKKEVDTSDTENEGAIRVTRSKRTVNTSSSTRFTTTTKSRKDSDVILQEIAVPVVVIDSDTETVSSQVNSEVENNTVDSKQVTDAPVESDEDDRPLKSRKPKKKTKTVKSKNDKVVKNVNCTVTLEKITLNDTHVVQKEAKISQLNTTHVIQKEANISSLNTTYVTQKEAKISPLNTTHVIETTGSTLTETNVISKDSKATLKMKSDVTKECSVILQKMKEPVTSSKNNAIADQTVVLTPKENRHQWKKADIPVPVDNLITDDDDSIVKATPEKKPEPPRKGIKTKQMFSPYANSPVRKRVAAFEKLVTTDSVDAPTRVTRTKTRNQEKEKENQTTKSRFITPIINNKLPSLIPQTDSKTYRQGTAANKNTSMLPTKSASAIKPSRAGEQLRREEEQRKRLEKEEEAKRKREALMLAKAEEQRKKREEKQLKAQKIREEIEREKEEKLRLVLQEREEEQQKKRELQAKKLAESEERRKAEEMMKLLKQREQERQRQEEEKRRRQLASKPPPLPTEDCEDSDSSSETTSSTKKYQKPDWAQNQNICRSLIIWRYISKARIESLWQMEATTPDLQEIFDTVDERILRRNSSAVWRTPPRYSTLPKF